MTDDPLFDRALQKAYRLLALRARSEKEIRFKLGKKGFEAAVVEAVIGRLYELRYLDDEAFARQWARHLAVDKLYGDRRIEMSLREKGIDRDLAIRIIPEVRRDIGERQAARRFIARKTKVRNGSVMDEAGKRRLFRSLVGRGFSPGLVYEILERSQEDGIDDDRQ